MDIKSAVFFEEKFEFEKDGKKYVREYRMEMPVGAPYGEAYQAGTLFMSQIVAYINDHQEKLKAVLENADKEEDVKEAAPAEEVKPEEKKGE